jgi:hypothetical protein
VVAITSGVNFKTSLTPTQSADMTELYMNEVYQFNLEFENTGDEDCPAPVYAITAPSGVYITGNRQDILGTIEPGVKKSVPIGVRCYTVAGDYEYKKINVTIRDGTGKTWEDSVSLRFYKETLDFNIKAERPVSGIVIAPDAKTYSFTDVTDGTVSAPRRMAGDYLVVFSGATIETETRYSLGVGLEADGYFGGFFDTSQYEPNNTEGSAVALGTQKIMAYLYKNDIDYYRVSYGEFNLLPTPTNVTASAADAKVIVSWNAVDGAISYNIYRSFGSNGIYSKVGASTTDSYVDTVGATGTYYYKVSAVNAGGFESVYSAPTEIMVTIEIDVTDLAETLSWLATNMASSTHYTLSLTRNETISAQTLSYSGKTDITITLKGKGGERTVSLEGNGSLFTVGDGVTLALDDGITLKGHSSNNAALVTINAGGTLLLQYGGKISGNTSSGSNGGGVEVASGGTFTQSGGEISSNSAKYGGGVYVNGTFTMSDGEISGNTAASDGRGGGVAVWSGTFTMSGGEISGNTTTNGGGGVAVINNGTFTMSDGTISGNTASGGVLSGNGGGVHVYGTFTMSGGEISGNTADGGGGVAVSGGTFTQSGGEISGNTAHGGGGVDVNLSGTFTQSGGIISGNTASSVGYYASGGGGVCVVGSNSRFTKQAGGIIYGSNADAGLKNTATDGNGHAVYVYVNSSSTKKRNTTAGVGITLDSGSAGGWE